MSLVTPVRRRQPVLVAAVLICAASMLALGAWAFLAPESFARFIDYPPYNRHLIHDAGAFQLGIGATVLLALWWSDALVVALTGFAMASGGVLGWVHHEDAAAATVAALERGRPGQAYNLVDDLPATWQEVYTAMAEAFGAPPPRRLPRWLFRLAAPYVASFAIDTSMRVSNAKAKAELGWRPAYRTYHDGIGAAASKEVPWRSHGRSGAGTRSA
jgi:hypothetical protein